MTDTKAVTAMLEARSVAVVGASAREGSIGEMILLELVRQGYDGDVFPVNPKYEEIRGFKCYASIAEVPEPVDLVILGVANRLLEEQLQLAADAGARSAAIFASGYEEPQEGVPPLTERLAKIARDHGIAVCGGNCMGFLNFDRKLRVCGFVEPDIPPGPITFISHSGSAFSAMAYNDRELRFNLLVSAGQEFVTTAADYMHYAVEQDTTRAIGLFIETVRDPENFYAAIERAAERDIPVVALKVGREERAREMVAAHSGALAGEDGAYEALFEAFGVLRVETLDEMADTFELFTRNGKRAGPGGLSTVHDSGGERAMIIDAAAEIGVRFADIHDETVTRLEATLEEGLPPVNPLDAWGTGNEAVRIFSECIRALLDDPDTAALAFAVDMTDEGEGEPESSLAIARAVLVDEEKPVAMLSNFSGAVCARDAKELRGLGVPVLEGTLTGLAAFRHLFEYRDYRLLPPVPEPQPPDGSHWRERLSSHEPMREVEALAMLAAYGVPVVEASAASNLETLLPNADGKYPVALKTAVPGVLHKSDAGGVKLSIRNEQELRAAYEDLASRLGPEVVVAPMAPSGVELALGVVRDPQFGPLVLVAAGGILVELLHDRRLGLPPLDEVRARRLLDGLKSRPLLDGVRGAPASDIEAVVRALVAVSHIAHDLGDLIEAIDVNPLIAGQDGCVAVDALVIPRV